ncbi:hypothetical protein H4Q26_012813 [Puccinia striiformis f. sp. tritici PST-130]|nr:hypothetical protein H4Q26_012813 [Puccinia striiformis f. sp. tritici PST-130]
MSGINSSSSSERRRSSVRFQQALLPLRMPPCRIVTPYADPSETDPQHAASMLPRLLPSPSETDTPLKKVNRSPRPRLIYLLPRIPPMTSQAASKTNGRLRSASESIHSPASNLSPILSTPCIGASANSRSLPQASPDASLPGRPPLTRANEGIAQTIHSKEPNRKAADIVGATLNAVAESPRRKPDSSLLHPRNLMMNSTSLCWLHSEGWCTLASLQLYGNNRTGQIERPVQQPPPQRMPAKVLRRADRLPRTRGSPSSERRDHHKSSKRHRKARDSDGAESDAFSVRSTYSVKTFREVVDAVQTNSIPQDKGQSNCGIDLGQFTEYIMSTSFAGSFVDGWVAGAFGSFLAFMQLKASTNQMYSSIFEISVATIVSFISRGLSTTGYFCYESLSSAGVVLILPGYIILCGSLELASKNLIAGSVKMVYAGFGISIGSTFTTFRPEGTSHHSDAFTRSCLHIVGFIRWMNGTFRDERHVYLFQCHWYIPTVSGTYNHMDEANARYGHHCVHRMDFDRSDVVSFLGAFVIGLLGNMYSRLFKARLLPVWLRCSLFGPFRNAAAGGLAMTYHSNSGDSYSNGLIIGFRMVQVAIGITVGLFFSSSSFIPLDAESRPQHSLFKTTKRIVSCKNTLIILVQFCSTLWPTINRLTFLLTSYIPQESYVQKFLSLIAFSISPTLFIRQSDVQPH